jgi:hypothetical protein
VVSLGIFSGANDGTMCPGVDSASKNEYQDTPESKAGRCLRLTTYHLLVPNVKKIWGLNLPDPHGPVQACSGTALLSTYTRVIPWIHVPFDLTFLMVSDVL